MKKIGLLEIFVIFTLLLTACGFKIVNNNKNKNIHIQKIELVGDKRITFLLKNQILLISSPQGVNKIKVNLQISKNKKVDSKNKQGKVDRYEVSVSVKLTVKNTEDEDMFKKIFKKKIRYNVSKNHSETIDVEKKAYENIQNSIGDEITNFMKLYFQN